MNDEGQMGNGGVCILNGSCPNLFTLGWADQSMVAFFPAAIGVALFGNNAVGVRLPSALMGTLSVLAVYLFTRETMGRKLAWAPALLLATLPVHIHFSRLAVDNILDSLSAPLILWLIFRGIKTGSRLYYLAAGLLCGLCLYSYQGSVLAPALGLGALAYVAMRTPGFLRAHARNILTLILAGLVVGLPMLGFYALHSNMFMSRFRAEGVVGNGILQQDTQDHQENTVEVLTVDFLRSSMVYIATPAAYGFYNSPYPYLPWLGAVFLIFGLAYTLRYIKHPLFLTLFVWFLAPIILGSTLTSGPPASQRMLMSMPPLAILISLGLGKTVEALQGLGKTVAKFSPLLLIVAVLYISAVDLHFFVYDYPAGHFFEDATNELTYESRLDIVPLGAQGHLYLLGEPTTPYLDFPNFSFFAPNVEKTTLYEVTPATIAALPKDKDILFLAIPSREADLESIRQWIPGGVWKQVNRRFQPTQVLYYTYKVTKAELARFKP